MTNVDRWDESIMAKRLFFLDENNSMDEYSHRESVLYQ